MGKTGAPATATIARIFGTTWGIDMDIISHRALPASDPAVPPADAGALGPALLRVAVLLAIVLAGAVIATNWNRWAGQAAVQSTDDAYLAADLTPMGARVQGLVKAVPVQDFQHVRQGDLLVQIRDDDYRAQVILAEADLAAAEAQLSSVIAQRRLQQANVAAAGTAVTMAEAGRQRDQAEDQRQRRLLASGIVGTQQRVEQAQAAAAVSDGGVLRAQAELRAATSQFALIDAQEAQARAGIQARQAALDLARINLGYTRIVAPTDGVVGARLVRAGQYVGVGTQAIAVVALPNVWVVANYRETQLTRVVPGQAATVTVDTLPGATLRGHVDSLSPGSGAQFALLPPDNATGNFTKVVQRITVKIVLDDLEGVGPQLRAGMSVTARIHTAAPGR